MPEKRDNEETVLREAAPDYCVASPGSNIADIDVSLLRESLLLTPWERMLANDDALNFAESLRVAMKKRNAKS